MRTPRESLQILLFLLARSHMPVASVNSLVIDVSHWAGPPSCPQLESLASDWADRLIGKAEAEPEYRFGIFNRVTGEPRSVNYQDIEAARRNLPRDSAMVPASVWEIIRGHVVGDDAAGGRIIEWEAEPYGQ